MKTYTKRIIEKFSDQDLYSWSVGLVYLQHFPGMMLEYEFIDRNNTVYPEGFADAVMDQVRAMDGLRMTDEEIDNLKFFTHAYFPSWFYVFLKGLNLKSSEVQFVQDKEGHLKGKIIGPAWRVVYWDQFLLAIVSELWHFSEGHQSIYDPIGEIEHAKSKAERLVTAGVKFCDMGTRRRFSRDHHEMVIDAMLYRSSQVSGDGSFFGSSNLWLASKHKDEGFKCIGTMSHQFISVCAAFFGPREANKVAMKKWYETYYGHLGCFLPDCLGTDAFYKNFSKEDAKLWGSLRIDSGDNLEEFKKVRDCYQSFGINPKDRGVVFSNGLNIETAIQLHQSVNGEMQDTYGLGTILTCGLNDTRIGHSNIVIKAVAAKLCESQDWTHLIKLSCNSTKAVGDTKTIEAYKTLLEI